MVKIQSRRIFEITFITIIKRDNRIGIPMVEELVCRIVVACGVRNKSMDGKVLAEPPKFG